jgi:hypothetical protein
VFIMSISRKTLALLTAAILGTGLVACQRGGQDKSASSQDQMNQAPKQGYTGPASPSTSSPSTAPGSAGEAPGGQPSGDTGSPGSANPSNSQQQPQQQPQQNQQQR